MTREEALAVVMDYLAETDLDGYEADETDAQEYADEIAGHLLDPGQDPSTLNEVDEALMVLAGLIQS